MERELEVIQSSLRRSLDEVRATASGLLLPHLGSLTISQAIEHVVRGHQRRTGNLLALTLTALPDQAPLAVKIALYRIVQEALTNVWRHAPGANVSINVSGVDGGLRVEIVDDGPGFDLASANGAEDQLGLFGMRERAESLGGEFHLASVPNQGTRLTATLPFATAEESDVGYAPDRDRR
jgi:signal transduction histidine kinase